MYSPQSSTIPLNEAGLFTSSQRRQMELLLALLLQPLISTSTSKSARSYFDKQSSLQDIKPLHLSHILWTSVADFGANIRCALAEQLTHWQFHPCQFFTKPNSKAEKNAPTSLSTVTNTRSATTLVQSDGEEGSRNDRMEVYDVGSVDVERLRRERRKNELLGKGSSVELLRGMVNERHKELLQPSKAL
ncbi:hypothetical protein BCR33DRAFT_166197 [Rhizoclosmatium globosum]|uniref:Uncharacterized protein n=1 Tax=Rhizoclosmatium globosum TaxID=329046 RepID=A0A1Y2AHI3_9FUNG|nr:hypothetical protein BCR33DRAFT_166197 [Rhizoclosmatium globosum]|eukprot:ORY22043.1 hypothetical protein BCR33DRAFT_166197 [Rhizoclosmatium globosum]